MALLLHTQRQKIKKLVDIMGPTQRLLAAASLTKKQHICSLMRSHSVCYIGPY